MVEMMNESGIPNHTRLSCKINLDIDGNIKGTKKKDLSMWPSEQN